MTKNKGYSDFLLLRAHVRRSKQERERRKEARPRTNGAEKNAA